MSADAIARLCEVLRVYDADHDDMGDYLVSMDDLRALLDAHEEALDALARIADPSNWGPDGGWDAKSYPDEIARAVLAKAGRR